MFRLFYVARPRITSSLVEAGAAVAGTAVQIALAVGYNRIFNNTSPESEKPLPSFDATVDEHSSVLKKS